MTPESYALAVHYANAILSQTPTSSTLNPFYATLAPHFPLSSSPLPHLSSPTLFHALLSLIADSIPLSYDGLLSLTRTLQTQHIRRVATSVRSDPTHLVAYNTRKTTEPTTAITSIAANCNYPPYLMAKIITEHVTGWRGKRTQGKRTQGNVLSRMCGASVAHVWRSVAHV